MDQPLAVIIEDDAAIADIFATALNQAKYQTLIIGDGLAAVNRLKTLQPVLILLDLHLPGLPGVRVLQAIRADERLKDVHVIVTSADATLTQYLRDEADLVLVKPVGFNQLIELATRMRQDAKPSH
jgi:CheY-like chemotaxis protein